MVSCSKIITDAVSEAVGSIAEKKQSVFETENYTVDTAMMTYYYLNDFYSYYNRYGMYLQYMGLDVTKSLAEQSYDESTSWYQYFVNSSANTATAYLLYAEAAHANGFEVAELDELVNDEIVGLTQSAEASGVSLNEYITNIFGEDITEADIRRALELEIYASEYYAKVEKDYSDSLTNTEFEAYYTANKDSLDKVDYRSFTITANDLDTVSLAEAEADAEALLSAASDGSFVSWVAAYLNEANADLETPLTDDEIQAKAEYVAIAQAYTAGNEASEWAFAADRKAGDVKLMDDGAGNYTVYVLENTPYRQDDPTRNVRHILIKTGEELTDEEARTKAEEILAEYRAGNKTEEAFDDLAKKYNQDSNSLYENVTTGMMVEEFNDWLFDPARMLEDTGIVKTVYGYHIMYYAGAGRPVWQTQAYESMLEAYITELVTGWQEIYTIDMDSDALASLPSTIPQTAFNSTTDTTVDTQVAVAQ